jgi:biopolymer transport protein ExbD
MRGRFRHRRIEPEEMNITAFMNLMVILVPFLLITAVFSRITILELNLPAAAAASPEVKRELQLEITIRPDRLDVGDRRAGLIKSLPKTDKGYDYNGLSKVLWQVKEQFPDKTSATILSLPDTPYDTLVQTMDAVRAMSVASAGSVTRHELFPEISIGDAPERTAAAEPPAKAKPAPKTGRRAK